MATVSFSMTGAAPVELPLRQFDADDYMAMVEAGVFEPRGRVELIEGYVVDMSPANSEHNYVVCPAYAALQNLDPKHVAHRSATRIRSRLRITAPT